MKNTFAGTFLIISILSFSTCMEEPIPEPLGPEPGWTQETVFEFTDYPYDFLVIDSVEY